MNSRIVGIHKFSVETIDKVRPEQAGDLRSYLAETKTVEMRVMALGLFDKVRADGWPKTGPEVETLADLRMELFWAMSERWVSDR